MKKKFISLFLSINLVVSTALLASNNVQASTLSVTPSAQSTNISKNESEIKIKLDRDARNSTPHNFRMCTKQISESSSTPDLTGLKELNISGSGQPTLNGLINMKSLLPSTENILILDLREESHLLVDGDGIKSDSSKETPGQYAISWSNSNNSGNEGKNLSEITEDESAKTQNLTSTGSVELTSDKYSSIKNISEVQNEEKLVKSQEFNYYRIPVTDGHKPTDEAVDTFINLIKSIQSNTWIHFHCLAGKGRTTTFMCMYDMMRNAKNVSFEDIINRQILIGGYDKVITGTDKEAKARAKFLKDFYNYCHDNKDDFATTWSKR